MSASSDGIVLENRVIVITGSSSGIGRAIVHAFAHYQTKLVLVSRNHSSLVRVREEAKKLGSDSIILSADVAREEDVRKIAYETVHWAGHIDVWINNAAVIAYGPFRKIPLRVFRRIMDVNLMGQVYGSRFALDRFTSRKEGILINMSSLVGEVPQPFAAPYVASEFAVKGFTESLQQEYIDYGDIHICLVMPASVDTPFFDHAANYSGLKVKPVRPVYRPEDVASSVLDLVLYPRHEAKVGTMAHFMSATHTVASGITRRLFTEQVVRGQFDDESIPDTEGNVFTSYT